VVLGRYRSIVQFPWLLVPLIISLLNRQVPFCWSVILLTASSYHEEATSNIIVQLKAVTVQLAVRATRLQAFAGCVYVVTHRAKKRSAWCMGSGDGLPTRGFTRCRGSKVPMTLTRVHSAFRRYSRRYWSSSTCSGLSAQAILRSVYHHVWSLFHGSRRKVTKTTPDHCHRATCDRQYSLSCHDRGTVEAVLAIERTNKFSQLRRIPCQAIL
jgi:general stress protein CsbA